MAIIGNPPLGFRFGVLFFAGGVIPNPLDVMFQKVSGVGSTVATQTVEEGGQNLYSQVLPEKIEHENLVLDRGVVVGSPLVIEFNVAMSLFKFSPSQSAGENHIPPLHHQEVRFVSAPIHPEGQFQELLHSLLDSLLRPEFQNPDLVDASSVEDKLEIQVRGFAPGVIHCLSRAIHPLVLTVLDLVRLAQ